MAFMAGEHVWIVNRQNLLVAVGHYYHFGALFNAFLGALGGLGVGAFSSALRIRNVAFYGCGVGGERDAGEHAQYGKSKTDQQQLLHSVSPHLVGDARKIYYNRERRVVRVSLLAGGVVGWGLRRVR